MQSERQSQVLKLKSKEQKGRPKITKLSGSEVQLQSNLESQSQLDDSNNKMGSSHSNHLALGWSRLRSRDVSMLKRNIERNTGQWERNWGILPWKCWVWSAMEHSNGGAHAHERLQGGEIIKGGGPWGALLWNPRKKVIPKKSRHVSPVQTEVRRSS